MASSLKLTYYARENYSWNSTRQRENVKEPTTDGHNDRQRQETVRGQVVLFIADWSWECHQLGLTNNSSDSCWITQRRVGIRIATRIMKRNFRFIVSHVTPNKLQQLRIRSRQSDELFTHPLLGVALILYLDPTRGVLTLLLIKLSAHAHNRA